MSADQTTGADGNYRYDFAPEQRRVAPASFQWRRHVLKFLIWTCSAVLAVLIVVFLFYAGIFESSAPDQPAEKVEVSGEAVNVGDLKFTGFDKKNQAYTISAATAEQDENEPNIVHLTRVEAELKVAKSGDVIFVQSDTGRYDTDAETVRLSDNINLKSTSGFSAKLSEAEVHLKAGRVHSDQPVAVTMPNGTIEANGVDIFERGKRIVFKNRIRLEYQLGDGKADSG